MQSCLSKFELRPYQKQAVEAISEKWDEWQKELLVLPTGCGKTVVFNTIAQIVKWLALAMTVISLCTYLFENSTVLDEVR